jgi:transcription antitermination factor NusG
MTSITGGTRLYRRLRVPHQLGFSSQFFQKNFRDLEDYRRTVAHITFVVASVGSASHFSTKATKDSHVKCEESAFQKIQKDIEKRGQEHRRKLQEYVDEQVDSLKQSVKESHDEAFAKIWHDFQQTFPQYAECAEFLNNAIDQVRAELDYREPKHPLLVNILLMQKFFQKGDDKTLQEIDIVDPKKSQFWDGVRRFMVYCRLSYPASSKKRLKAAGDSHEIVVQHLVDEIGISKEEIMMANLESVPRAQVSEESLCPRYYVIKDRTRREVVVVVRGTADANDAISDLLAKTTPFLDGIAHDGIARGAQALFNNVKEDLKRLAEKQYKLVITGHSLAAGTVHLIQAFMINDGLHKLYSNMETYAFAPPSTFKGHWPTDDHSAKVYSFVNEDDVVPRISTRNMARYIYLLSEIDAAPWDPTTRAKILMGHQEVSKDELPSLEKEPCPEKYVDFSWAPGECYHLRKDGIYVEKEEKFTKKLELTADCLANHGISKYIQAFDETKERLKAKKS